MVFFSVEAACCLPSYSIFPSPECFLASGSCKTLFSNMQHSELTAVAEQGSIQAPAVQLPIADSTDDRGGKSNLHVDISPLLQST